jgi:hypothetical protein
VARRSWLRPIPRGFWRCVSDTEVCAHAVVGFGIRLGLRGVPLCAAAGRWVTSSTGARLIQRTLIRRGIDAHLLKPELRGRARGDGRLVIGYVGRITSARGY